VISGVLFVLGFMLSISLVGRRYQLSARQFALSLVLANDHFADNAGRRQQPDHGQHQGGSDRGTDP
jgi:hypothetical protein